MGQVRESFETGPRIVRPIAQMGAEQKSFAPDRLCPYANGWHLIAQVVPLESEWDSAMPGAGMIDPDPLPYGAAAWAIVQCIGRSLGLLRGRRLRLPRNRVGLQLRFAGGTSARVYRETVVAGREPREPCVLFVAFRLRLVRGWGHAVFRAESLLNTPLFVGFPSFVSKLWLAHDQNGTSRGVYQGDRPDCAEHYARALWRLLALVCVPGSIHYMVVPGLRRDAVLAVPPNA
jgi:hypothetical protein